MIKLTPTGRFPTSPEIQNLPGTPAHALEMYYARHGKSRYPADEWGPSHGAECSSCEQAHAEYVVIDIGPDSRYLYRCKDCGNLWWGED